MTRKLIAAAIAAFASTGAGAVQTFNLAISGTGDYFYYWGVPGGCDQYPDGPDLYNCQAGFVYFDWGGLMAITTSSASDGTYTGERLESVSFTSPYDNFFFHGTDRQTFSSDAPLGWIGPEPGSSVTITNGRVTAVHVDFVYVPGNFNMSGLHMTESDGAGWHAADSWDLQGTASQYASTVPEPASAGLFLLGLGLLAAGRRRRA